MAAPHYVATKVGDQYVLVPADGPGGGAALLAGAAALLAAAAVGRGSARWVLAAAGGGVVAAWYARHRSRAVAGRPGGGTGLAGGPSFPRESAAAAARGVPADAVDEASMESFPASDPPAHTPPPS